MNILEEGLDLFEQGEYEKSIEKLIFLYEQGIMQEEILDFIYTCFIQPNEEEFLANYNSLNVLGKKMEYHELSIDFIPVSERRFYLYDKIEKCFLSYIDIPDGDESSEQQLIKSLLISRVWDVRKVLSEVQKFSCDKYYVLLSADANNFLSFAKLPEFSRWFGQNLCIFSSLKEMSLFFEMHPEEEIPQNIIGENIEKNKQGLAIIQKLKSLSTEKHQKHQTSRLFFQDCFFEPEVRDGFEISTLMKRAWAAELELLQLIHDICEENNLTYYAEGGTLLGAIRHKGFIPWDDDIDISMFREDYEKFVEIIKRDYSDLYAIHGFIKNDAKLTTHNLDYSCFGPIISNWDYEEYLAKFHNFPFSFVIDIFPMDYVSVNDEVVKMQQTITSSILQVLQNRDVLVENGEYSNKIAQLEEVLELSLRDRSDREDILYQCFINILTISTRMESDRAALSQFFYMNNNWIYAIDWFSSVEYVPFESINIAIPKEWHKVLTQDFGEYMKPVRDVALHEYPFYKSIKIAIEQQLSEKGFEVEKYYKNPAKYTYLLMLSELEA